MQSVSDLRNRLLALLAKPGVSLATDRGTLLAQQDRLAVLEWPDEGKGLVLVDDSPELASDVERILSSHQGGLLFVVAVGGGADIANILKEADRVAPNRDHLGVYHLNGEGRLSRVAGRRLGLLENAAPRLAQVQPLDLDEVPALIERGRQERIEAAAFARNLSGRLPRLTFAIIAVCLLVHAALDGSGASGSAIKNQLSANSAEVLHGEIWRVFTYAFLHANLVHLLVNMFALYSLGGFLEALLGRTRYLLVYCASALGGGIASVAAGAVHQALGDLPSSSVGASGAIWGLMGATLGLVLSRQRVLPRLVARGLRQRLLFVLVINIALSFVPGIDMYAHFGGGLVGFLLARGGRAKSAERRTEDRDTP